MDDDVAPDVIRVDVDLPQRAEIPRDEEEERRARGLFHNCQWGHERTKSSMKWTRRDESKMTSSLWPNYLTGIIELLSIGLDSGRK